MEEKFTKRMLFGKVNEGSGIGGNMRMIRSICFGENIFGGKIQ